MRPMDFGNDDGGSPSRGNRPVERGGPERIQPLTF